MQWRELQLVPLCRRPWRQAAAGGAEGKPLLPGPGPVSSAGPLANGPSQFSKGRSPAPLGPCPREGGPRWL